MYIPEELVGLVVPMEIGREGLGGGSGEGLGGGSGVGLWQSTLASVRCAPTPKQFLLNPMGLV